MIVLSSFPNHSTSINKQKKIFLQCRRYGRSSFDSWVGKIPWRRKWHPTPVFLSGKFYGQRSLAVYSGVTKGRMQLSNWVTAASWICSSVCVLTCPALCNLKGCSPSNSTVYGISQARMLEWVAMSSSRVSSWPRDQTRVSCVSCISRCFVFFCFFFFNTVPPSIVRLIASDHVIWSQHNLSTHKWVITPVKAKTTPKLLLL